ncbi:MAG: DUF1003 domain-containing protein [Candidatus Altimarinota bacterium]
MEIVEPIILKDEVCKDCGKAAATHKHIIQTFRSKYSKKMKWYDRFADFMTEKLGTVFFLALNAVWFLIWIVWNTGIIPGLQPFDPYPYGFLTMTVSLEAIFLSIIVLISQNRSSMIADMREEIDYNVNVRAEKEITKILNIVDKIQDHLGVIEENDLELEEMKIFTNIEEMEEAIAQEYGKYKR